MTDTSTDTTVDTSDSSSDDTAPAVQSAPVVNTPLAPAVPRILSEDKAALDLAKAKAQVALETAKTFLAKSETAELQFRYLVLSLYRKYGLATDDAINDDGTVSFGGAKQS